MNNDIQIQNDIIEQLSWDPFLQLSEIGVIVKNGIVTLSGQVDSYARKVAAENAVRKISGVKAIAEDIRIDVSPAGNKNDAEIALAVYTALKWHVAVQEENIKIKVENGHVQLEGEVDWEYQRKNAEKTIENIMGVRALSNLIRLKQRITTDNIEQKINYAFHRSANLYAEKIAAQVYGNKVILRGTVRSFAEREDAENAAWSAPGVNIVEDNLVIEKPEFAMDE